ncbi:PFL family protein [Gordonibacter pamelaeae]|uniref:PFL family protein n=3 Tax=Actinomycetota TaxID=201174 RepID=UPI003A935D85
MQITPAEIAETLAMVSKQHLDIRTITLGLNLRGCTDADIDVMARKVYDRMTTAAEQLVPTAEQLEREYGIPIVNKRISVTPIAEICAATDAADLTPIAVAMDRAGKEVGVDFVGGFSALVHKGATRADHKLMDSIPTALAATDRVCASVNVGSTRAGINMDAAFKMAGIVKRAAELTADRQCIGAGKEVGVDFVGGFSALVHKGASAADHKLMDSIPHALSVTDNVCSSVNVGSTRAGINMDAVLKMAGIVKATAEATADRQCIGAGKLVVFCNAVEDNPFMAGAFHGSGEADAVVNVGVSGPGVVRAVLADLPKDADLTSVAEAIKATAFKITRAGELMAREASKRLGVQQGILDLSLAPTPAEGDSVAEILEAIGVGQCGGPGTTAALAMLNDAVKKGGVMASSSVGGLSGAFIPVSEDAGMIRAAEDGALSLEKLEAMTCVCSVGLDMIAIPGDTSASTISGLIADEAAIGMVNQKTTAVRVIPVAGKGVGEMANFGGLMGYAPIMPVNQTSCEAFVTRGGRIPAPIHSFKN